MEFNNCFNPFTLLSSWVWKSHKNTNLSSGFSLNTAKMEGLVVSSSSVSSENGSGDSCSLSSESLSSSIDEKNLTLGWPIRKGSVKNLVMGDEKNIAEDEQFDDKPKTSVSEIEMMKERYSKLLLGEDMSGCGKGVCTALAISNALTNLCATLFGELWRLEPLSTEKKAMWKREMEWLLCVSDHIVEFLPSCQIFPDGSKLEVMTCRPRSDLFINLPALRKLDTMLLEILDSFHDQEFWYIDQGILAQDSEGSASFRGRPFQRQEEKWWLPVPRVPPGGLQEVTRKKLQHKRECTNQILKAVMVINDGVLLEMEVPQSYFESLPKNARECLGDVIYRYITSDQFSPECLLDCLEFSSEHQALEIANRVEASTYIWRRKNTVRNKNNADRMDLLADRAESIMLCLKQRFPGLTQTSLDMSKIQFNKVQSKLKNINNDHELIDFIFQDVGKSILESYSRVLESVAFNIIARIDDLLYVDDLAKHSDQSSSTMLCKKVALPYATTSYSPTPSISSAVKAQRTPFALRKASNHGFGVKKVLTDYLNGEVRGRHNSIFEK